jgi:hypothetical protein
MDTLTFISQITSHVAWPLAVIVIAIILRQQISNAIQALADRLENVKFPGGEANFRNKIQEVKQAAQDADFIEPAMNYQKRKHSDERVERWLRLAETSPDAVVLEAWRDLEVSLRDTAKRLDLPIRDVRTPLGLITSLSKKEILDPSAVAMLENLRGLRNELAHGKARRISLSDALDYASVAENILSRLEQKQDSSNNKS